MVGSYVCSWELRVWLGITCVAGNYVAGNGVCGWELLGMTYVAGKYW